MHNYFDTLTSRELARAGAVSYRQVDYWCRIGYLRTVQDASGSGSRRLFDRDEVLVARVLGTLSRLGAHGEPLRAAAEVVRAAEPDSWVVGHLVVTPEGTARPALFVLGDELDAGGAWVLDVGLLAEATADALANMPDRLVLAS